MVSCGSPKENEKLNELIDPRPTSSRIIAEMDSNQDGKLTPEEVKGPIAIDFNTLDANKDGYLDINELDRAEKKQGKRASIQNSTQ